MWFVLCRALKSHDSTFYAWFTLARETENGIKQSAIFRRGKSWNMDVRIPEIPPPLVRKCPQIYYPPPPLSADVFYEQPLMVWLRYVGMLFELKIDWLIDWLVHLYPPITRKRRCAICFGQIRTRLGVDHFPSFPVDVLTSSHINLLLIRSHQAEIIIVKRLIQGCNNVTRVRRLNSWSCDQSRRKNDAFTL